MPHLILEYTQNLPAFDVPETLHALNSALAQTGHFPLTAIKSRAYCVADYMIADDHQNRIGFAALRLHTRLDNPDHKKAVAENLLDLIKTHIPPLSVGETQYTVDIIKMDEACYSKDVVTRS